MQQVRVTRGNHKKDPCELVALLDALPLDPRDPDIARVRHLQRKRQRT